MKYFNVLYVGLMSLLIVLGMRGMDIAEMPKNKSESIEAKVVNNISTFIHNPQPYLLYDLSVLIKELNLPAKASLLINKENDLAWFNRILNLQNTGNVERETIKDLKQLRLRIMQSTSDINLCCQELKNIFHLSKIEDKEYTLQLIDTLKEQKKSKKLKDSLESLIIRMQDKIIAPSLISHFKPDFEGAKVILPIVCNATYFDKYPRQINNIIESETSDTQKRQSLSRLYDELENLQKIVGTNPKTTSNILSQKLNIKKTYKTLQKVPTSLWDLPVGDDIFSQSSLNWNNTFNDLHASFILSDDNNEDLDKQQAFEAFENASQSFLDNINSLRNQPEKKDNYNEIIKSLDTMSAYIYAHDLSPQKKDAPYTAYRCWLLELIKKTIETNNDLSENMIDDWKNEVSSIVDVTKKRFQNIDGNLGETKIQVEALIAEKKPSSKIKNLPTKPINVPAILSLEEKQKKEAIRASVNEMEKQLGPNAFNAAFLSNFLTKLKNYKKTLLSTENSEQIRISNLIKDIAKKIRKIAVIKPRPQSKKKQIEKEFQNISSSISSKSGIDIENTITDLEKLLPFGDYDALKAIDKKDTQLYPLLLKTLNTCVQSLLISEKKRLDNISEQLDINYFKRISYQISLFKSLQGTTNDGQILTSIIESYHQLLNEGITFLMNQIKTPSSLLNISAKIRTNMIGQYLGNDVILNPYFERMNTAIQQQKQQEIANPRLKQIETPVVSAAEKGEGVNPQISSIEQKNPISPESISAKVPQIPLNPEEPKVTVKPKPLISLQPINPLEQEDDETEDLERLSWGRKFVSKLETIKTEVSNKSIEQLKESIDDLKGYLPTTSRGVLQITAQGKSDTYKKIIETLHTYIQELAKKEKSELQKDTLPIDYFKEISSQIQLFEAVSREIIDKNSENYMKIENIITLYHEMIKTGIQLLKEKISEIESFKQIDMVNSYLGGDNILEPYLNEILSQINGKSYNFQSVAIPPVLTTSAVEQQPTTSIIPTPPPSTVTPTVSVIPPSTAMDNPQQTNGPLAALTSKELDNTGITIENQTPPPVEEPKSQPSFLSRAWNGIKSVWNSFWAYFGYIG